MEFEKLSFLPFLMAGIFFLLFFLERILPLRESTRSLWSRIGTNLAVSALAFAVGFAVVRPAAREGILWSGERGIGLLHAFPLPAWFRLVLAFLLMDLTFYYWHRVNHVWGLFWRFHRVHHIDPDLDVTTSFRFHPGEIFYSALFRIAQVVFLGITPTMYLAYEAVFQCATMFHHSNFRLPIHAERGLNWIFVTPRMHGIHHSVKRKEVNSNFSVIFRWWDFFHRTLRLNVPQMCIRIGVPGYSAWKDNAIMRVLLLPFRSLEKAAQGLAEPLPQGPAKKDISSKSFMTE